MDSSADVGRAICTHLLLPDLIAFAATARQPRLWVQQSLMSLPLLSEPASPRILRSIRSVHMDGGLLYNLVHAGKTIRLAPDLYVDATAITNAVASTEQVCLTTLIEQALHRVDGLPVEEGELSSAEVRAFCVVLAHLAVQPNSIATSIIVAKAGTPDSILAYHGYVESFASHGTWPQSCVALPRVGRKPASSELLREGHFPGTSTYTNWRLQLLRSQLSFSDRTRIRLQARHAVLSDRTTALFAELAVVAAPSITDFDASGSHDDKRFVQDMLMAVPPASVGGAPSVVRLHLENAPLENGTMRTLCNLLISGALPALQSISLSYSGNEGLLLEALRHPSAPAVRQLVVCEGGAALQAMAHELSSWPTTLEELHVPSYETGYRTLTFVEALCSRGGASCGLRRLTFRDATFDVTALVPDSEITELDLSGERLCRIDIEFLCAMLEAGGAPALRHLNLSHTRFDQDAPDECLLTMLANGLASDGPLSALHSINLLGAYCDAVSIDDIAIDRFFLSPPQTTQAAAAHNHQQIAEQLPQTPTPLAATARIQASVREPNRVLPLSLESLKPLLAISHTRSISLCGQLSSIDCTPLIGIDHSGLHRRTLELLAPLLRTLVSVYREAGPERLADEAEAALVQATLHKLLRETSDPLVASALRRYAANPAALLEPLLHAMRDGLPLTPRKH